MSRSLRHVVILERLVVCPIVVLLGPLRAESESLCSKNQRQRRAQSMQTQILHSHAYYPPILYLPCIQDSLLLCAFGVNASQSLQNFSSAPTGPLPNRPQRSRARPLSRDSICLPVTNSIQPLLLNQCLRPGSLSQHISLERPH